MEGINLSHSRADTFCGRQIYYRDVAKKEWVENYYTAMGHICEAGVNAELQNRINPILAHYQKKIPAVSAMYCGGVPLVHKAQHQLMDDLIHSSQPP